MLTTSKGFTLVEILLVMGMIGVISGVAFINFLRPQSQANLDSITQTLIADLKSQQIKAMAGDSGSGTTSEPHGIRVQAGDYTLFKGASYSALDSDNFTVTAETGVTLSTTLPSSVVIFTEGSGDISGYNAGQDTITLTSSATATSKVITLNRYGAVTVN